MSENTKAIVTFTLGRHYTRFWHEYCRPNWTVYAERHGYDIVCLDRALDASERAQRRSPSWQKCLILDQPFAKRYERIVWIDADVMINPSAPSIVESVPVQQVGAVNEYATPTPALYSEALHRLYRHWEQTRQPFIRNETVAEFYEQYGLAPRTDGVVQAGVMVLSPDHHRELLLSVYHRYESRGALMNGEMRPLSHELLEAGCVTWIDPRFNYRWPEYTALHFPFLLSTPDHPRAVAVARAALGDVYFLHFTGDHTEVRLVQDGPLEPPRRPARTSRSTAPNQQSRSGDWRMMTPVVLFLYARPDTTRRVLDAIRRVRPPKLLVVADAPGLDERAELTSRVRATRALLDEIDWDCDVVTNFARDHQGLNKRVLSGLDWAFELVEEAVVLEDDCVADPTFFRFCEEQLDRYRDTQEVISVGGNDFSSDPNARPDRYRFSRYTLIWGWATWRRAWRLHDPTMSDWPQLRDSGWLEQLLADPHAVAYWRYIFEQTYSGRFGWDYAWTFTCWRNSALCIHPEVNLVSNVGFGAEATNTRAADSVFANMPTRPAEFPLVHPLQIARDPEADALLEEVLFSGNLARMFGRMRRGRRLVRARSMP